MSAFVEKEASQIKTEKEEQARQEWVHAEAYPSSWWNRLKAWLWCQKGHDPVLHQPLWFVPFDTGCVTCSRCNQMLKAPWRKQ